MFSPSNSSRNPRRNSMIKKVLITGVAGFIGSNLLDFLIENTEWKIVGIDNLSTGSKNNIAHNLSNNHFEFIIDSLYSIKTLRDYDCVFHLAALPRIQPSFELVNEHIQANLMSSMHLVELMIVENHFPRFIN